ncbi:MAG: hypothetical protein ACOX9E_10695 [Lentisphaeria bacterium]
MKKQKKTTRKKNRRNAASRAMVCTLEPQEDQDTGETYEWETTWRFANGKALAKEAVARPDIFLKCCCSFFDDMISCAEKDYLSPHPDALGMAEKGSLLFWDLDLAFSYGVIQDAFAAAQEAAKAVIIKKMYETKPKD